MNFYNILSLGNILLFFTLDIHIEFMKIYIGSIVKLQFILSDICISDTYCKYQRSKEAKFGVDSF